MPHNIETYREIQKRKGFDPGDVGGTVLTVRDPVGGEKLVALYFRDDAVVINPWGEHPGDIVKVAGEDLYALRELLNELPEEAFVRPADPVAESYVVGAFINGQSQSHLYVYDAALDAWDTVDAHMKGDHADVERYENLMVYKGFDGWKSLTTILDIDAEPTKPRWTDGDIVVLDRDDDTTVVYVRSYGTWDRTVSGRTNPGDSRDEIISNLVDQPRSPYEVVRQQNA